jgi:hypothetical protein
MRIYIDIDSRRILTSATRPATRLEFKRRDNDAFEVQFLRAGAVQSLPVGTIARVGVKATEDFAGEFLATDTLSVTGTGADTVYRGAFNLNTTALEALFPTEPASITAMLEVQWMSGTSVGSSLTLPITIFNDVIRGDEGAPADLPLFYTSQTSNFLATQAEAEAGSDNTKWMSPLRVAQAIEELGGGGGVTSYEDLTDIPSTFPPSTHTHPLSALTQSSATSGQVPTWSGTAWVPQTPNGGSVTSYNDLTDVPSTFPPEAHTHAATDITTGTLANARTTATNANTASAIVSRDASGNFSAGTITASLTGTASGNAPATGIAQSAVTNLTTDLAGKAASSHTHAATDITSGTLALARIPTGTTSSTVALGNHTHSSYATTSGGITAITVVASMPATPNSTTLYIVTG